MSSRIPPWITELAGQHHTSQEGGQRTGGGGVVGTVARIDAAARRRGLAAARGDTLLSLARDMPLDDPANPRASLEVRWKHTDAVAISSDVLQFEPHGLSTTHLDALSHFQVEGTLYGGLDHSTGSIAQWAGGILTRAVFLDIPYIRGTPYVDPFTPVNATDLDTALEHAGTTIEPGDALLIYMGRDAYEAAGHTILPLSTCPPGRPGIGQDGAQWISRQPLSVLCWDFVDAYLGGDDRTAHVHLLIWAIGLALVDNCNLCHVRQALHDRPTKTAMLTISPLPIPRTTASPVNPLFLT
jgi:kynurenine formamidase